MRAVRLAVVLVGLIVGIQCVPVYYNSLMFNDFVKEEAQHTRMKAKLQEALLSKANAYSLPVKPSDIVITTGGSVFRVSVDYSVPVNLLVYTPELKSHAIGSGLFRD